MSKNVIIAAFLGILIIGGGAFALLSNNDSSDDNTNATNNTSNVGATDNPLGLDISTASGPYRVNIMTTDVSGRTTDASADIDADGNISTTVTDNDQSTSFILVNNETFVKSPGDDGYIKFPASDSSPISSSDLNVGFTQEDIDEIKDLDIVDKGTGPCTNGSCRIYETTDPETGDKGTIKVTTDSNRLSDVEITSASGDEIQMSYDYSANINIAAPENFTEFEIPDVSDIDLDSLQQELSN